MNISIVHVQKKHAVSLHSFRSGSFVSFTVKENKGNGVYTVVLNNMLLQVQSKKKLNPGQQYRAVLLKLLGKIELKILANKTLSSKVLNDLSLPVTKEMNMIVTALMRSGIPVNSATIGLMQKGSTYINKKNKALYRLLAFMIEKQIPITKDSILSLYGLFNFSEGNSERGAEQRNKKNNDNKKGKNQNEAIDSTLKNYILRDDGKDSLLKYFNHRKGQRNNSIIIPLKYHTDTDHSGVLTVKHDMLNNLLGFTLQLQDRASWKFVLSKEQEGYRMEVFSDNIYKKQRLLPLFKELKEKLHNKGIKIDDIKSNNSFTGNFFGESDIDYKSINEVV